MLSLLIASSAFAGAAAPAPRPPCIMSLGVSYWDGSGWEPMNVASSSGAENGIKFKARSPFKAHAALPNVIALPNPAADLTVKPETAFCVRLSANVDPSAMMIGIVDVKKGYRELQTCMRCASPNMWLMPKSMLVVETTRTSDTTIEITPKSPLPAGQYVIGGPPIKIGLYDFGVAEEPPASH